MRGPQAKFKLAIYDFFIQDPCSTAALGVPGTRGLTVKKMNCPRCSVENSDATSYCQNCGQVLDQRLVALEAALATRLDDRIKAVIDARFKDVKLLEIEVAEGIAKRLSEWGKIIGFFIGIPLMVVTAVLGFLGVKSFTDFSTTLKQATDEESTRIQAHGKELMQTLDEQVKESPVVQQIQNEVNDLKTKFTILASPSMAATDKSQLDNELQRFQAYLMKVGFQANDNVEVRIGEEDSVCYYDPIGQRGKPEIFIQKTYVNQTDVLLSEYARHVLMSERPTDMIVPPGKVNAFSTLSNYSAIGWGLTYYFVCCYRDRAVFWPNAPQSEWSANLSKTGRLILTGSIPRVAWTENSPAELWGALCWDIRGVLGKEKTCICLRETWFSLNENDPSEVQPQHFCEKIISSVAKIENGKFTSRIAEVFKNRGL
jgi:hypothetical protein